MDNKIPIVEKPNDEKKEEEKPKIENDKDEDEKNKNKNDDGGKGELTEEKIEEIFNDLEDEFYVSGFIKEDIVKEKIKELNGDIIQLREFIESLL